MADQENPGARLEDSLYQLELSIRENVRIRGRRDRQLVELLEALEAIADRVDELETDDHKAVAFEDVRGLQEEARAAVRSALAGGQKPAADRFDYSRIPPLIRQSLDAYARDGRPLGHFLTAVLTNHLFEACNRADNENAWVLPVIVAYIFNHLPTGCWGSSERMTAWREHRGLEGLGHPADAPLPDTPVEEP